MLKINDTNRLTREELEDYRVNSGITALQYEIIKRRYFDPRRANGCSGLFGVENISEEIQ